MAGVEQAEEGEEGEGHETQDGKRELPGAKLDLPCIHGSSLQGQLPVCSSLSETEDSACPQAEMKIQGEKLDQGLGSLRRERP